MKSSLLYVIWFEIFKRFKTRSDMVTIKVITFNVLRKLRGCSHVTSLHWKFHMIRQIVQWYIFTKNFTSDTIQNILPAALHSRYRVVTPKLAIEKKVICEISIGKVFDMTNAFVKLPRLFIEVRCSGCPLMYGKCRLHGNRHSKGNLLIGGIWCCERERFSPLLKADCRENPSPSDLKFRK